jgi:hypothetical protein
VELPRPAAATIIPFGTEVISSAILNRYGQARPVEVYTLRNPATVESRIWDKLNSKIDQITRTLGSVMDEPEDLLQLVLGMTSPGLFRELFADAAAVPPERLSEWFDQKTARFGGQDVLRTVRDLVGHCARFDFQQVSEQIPRLDLPDLRPFFTAMLERNHRRVQEDDGGISFKTPDAWSKTRGVRPSYQGLVFDREAIGGDTQRVVGVGNLIFDLAVEQARGEDACLTWLSADALERSLFIFRVSDRVTAGGGSVRAVVLGVEVVPGPEGRVLGDWELLRTLNRLTGEKSARRPSGPPPVVDSFVFGRSLEAAQKAARLQLPQLQLPFRHPDAELVAVIWSGLPSLN